MATKHSLGSTAPSSSAGGRPPALKPEHIAVLHEILVVRAQARLQKIADELHIRHHDRKLTVSEAWVWLVDARMLLNRLAFRSFVFAPLLICRTDAVLVFFFVIPAP